MTSLPTQQYVPFQTFSAQAVIEVHRGFTQKYHVHISAPPPTEAKGNVVLEFWELDTNPLQVTAHKARISGGAGPDGSAEIMMRTTIERNLDPSHGGQDQAANVKGMFVQRAFAGDAGSGHPYPESGPMIVTDGPAFPHVRIISVLGHVIGDQGFVDDVSSLITNWPSTTSSGTGIPPGGASQDDLPNILRARVNILKELGDVQIFIAGSAGEPANFPTRGVNAWLSAFGGYSEAIPLEVTGNNQVRNFAVAGSKGLPQWYSSVLTVLGNHSFEDLEMKGQVGKIVFTRNGHDPKQEIRTPRTVYTFPLDVVFADGIHDATLTRVDNSNFVTTPVFKQRKSPSFTHLPHHGAHRLVTALNKYGAPSTL